MTEDKTGASDRQTISTEALKERTQQAHALLEKYAREQDVKPFVDDRDAPAAQSDEDSTQDMVWDIYARRQGREPLRISISGESFEVLHKLAAGEELATFVGHLVDFMVLDARTRLGRETLEQYVVRRNPAV